MILFMYTVQMLVLMPMGVSLFGYERNQYFRDMSVGQNGWAYYFGKVLESIPAILLYTVAYAGGFFGMSELRQSFGRYFAALLSTSLGFVAIAILASITIGREKMIPTAIITGLIMVAFFTGLTPKAGNIAAGAKWIWYLTFSFNSATAFYSNEVNQYDPPYDVAYLNNPDGPWGSTYGYGFNLDQASLYLGLAFITALATLTLGAIFIRAWDYRKQR